MNVLKNYLVSIIRTAVPMLVGAITGWLATRHITLDTDALRFLTLFCEGVAGITYYLVVRALEHFNVRFGWLLGYAHMPTYTVSPLPGAEKRADELSAAGLPMHDAATDSNL